MLVGEVVAAAVEAPEDVVPAAAPEVEEPEADLETLPEEEADEVVDEVIALEAPEPVAEAEEAAAALAVEAEMELNSDSLLALLDALILLMASATVLAAVPLAVKGVAEPATQVVRA